MLNVSLLFITIVTVFSIVRIYRQKTDISQSGMHVHIIIMTVSMIASLAVGIVFGIMFMHNLATSSLLAGIFGMMIGFIVGKPFHPIASLGGMAEGLMGGVMGAMTGEMIHMAVDASMFLLITDGLFLSFMISVQWVLSAYKPKTNPLTTPSIKLAE
ncbi:hypothetical protein MUN88_10970 [Gracilibacillus caseinilyticus]|uniref:Uncharacterized protein n=1 Tax=Gracilibacillus caseinilyticus TaxID=2932256 RepID=A0ABY4EQA0_9BACI|nr:hypothetical protein [Gracilibacillus caseinilyticus]UOQ46629.1 hypothetical protein MUN88_10970 [Gracilibacillus caseinilyticus]